MTMLRAKLARMVVDGHIQAIGDEFQLFVCDNGQETTTIITRDTESGELVWYQVYMAKCITEGQDGFDDIHFALDMVEED